MTLLEEPLEETLEETLEEPPEEPLEESSTNTPEPSAGTDDPWPPLPRNIAFPVAISFPSCQQASVAPENKYLQRETPNRPQKSRYRLS